MIASGSRAGLVGVFAAAALLVGMNFKNFKRDWKRYASIIAVFFVIAFVFNFQNPARVFGKVNSLFSDAGKVIEQEKEAITGTASDSGDQSSEANNDCGETLEAQKDIRYGEGFTTLGSGRGYIWYKTFGMMKDTLVTGNGPDTYVMKFPHADAFKENFNKITDKPHNLYLQIAVNQGLIALLAFLFLNTYAFHKLFKRIDYRLEDRKDQIFIILCAPLFGYLVTSLFNDSVVSVAPLYWAMLGMMFSVLNSKQKTSVPMFPGI